MTECLPEYYPDFINWLKNREYPYQGSLGRTGIQKPFVREIRLFDVNVREAVMGNFLGEIKNFYYEGISNYNEKGLNLNGAHFSKRKIDFIKGIINTVTPLKAVDMDRVKPVFVAEKPVPGPVYMQVLGRLNDPKAIEGNMELM